MDGLRLEKNPCVGHGSEIPFTNKLRGTMMKFRICVPAFALVLAWTPSTLRADPPSRLQDKDELEAREEIIPGVPLDGSIVIDESIWVSLIGEPGVYMSDAYQNYVQGKMDASAAAVRKASSFLAIASHNALAGFDKNVQRSAEELADLRDRIAAGEVKSEEELKTVFGRAHLAMSRHHIAKAAQAMKEKKWALASNYLRSAARYFQQASWWTGHELQASTRATITEAKQTAKTMVRDESKSIENAGRLIESLGQRIESFGKSLAKQADSESQPPGKDVENE